MNIDDSRVVSTENILNIPIEMFACRRRHPFYAFQKYFFALTLTKFGLSLTEVAKMMGQDRSGLHKGISNMLDYYSTSNIHLMLVKHWIERYNSITNNSTTVEDFMRMSYSKQKTLEAKPHTKYKKVVYPMTPKQEVELANSKDYYATCQSLFPGIHTIAAAKLYRKMCNKYGVAGYDKRYK